MLVKIPNNIKSGNHHIKMLYPGLVWNNADTGLATIGRIDHANIQPGVLIAMHPHVNDEILSYFRSGIIKHTDSEGFSEFIEPKRLMLMKAGKLFYHEEKLLDDSEPLEGLQIFIRPKQKDLNPKVTFRELEDVDSIGQWRLLAGPSEDSTLQLSSDTWISDGKWNEGSEIHLSERNSEDVIFLLYVFRGRLQVNDIVLEKGDSIIIKDEIPVIKSLSEVELVCFETSEEAEYYDGGMYSGNKRI